MKTQEQLLEQLERVFELPPAEPNERGRLGLLQLGATRLEAIGGPAPGIVQNGRVVVGFSLAAGQEAAEQAAVRTFQRLVARELRRKRTPAELRRRMQVCLVGRP